MLLLWGCWRSQGCAPSCSKAKRLPCSLENIMAGWNNTRSIFRISKMFLNHLLLLNPLTLWGRPNTLLSRFLPGKKPARLFPSSTNLILLPYRTAHGKEAGQEPDEPQERHLSPLQTIPAGALQGRAQGATQQLWKESGQPPPDPTAGCGIPGAEQEKGPVGEAVGTCGHAVDWCSSGYQ